jgi:hypothetical protein
MPGIDSTADKAQERPRVEKKKKVLDIELNTGYHTNDCGNDCGP